MDDEQYRQTRAAIPQSRCLYEKAIQYGYFQCQWHKRIALGERESLHCTRRLAFEVCEEFHALCLKHSGFALGATKMPVHLSFNQAMKVQIGGVRGAIHLSGKSIIEPDRKLALERQDVADELAQLKAHCGGTFESINFSKLMPQISGFSLRKRRK